MKKYGSPSCYEYGTCHPKQDEDGEYYLVDDVDAVLAAKDAEIAELEEQLREWQYAYGEKCKESKEEVEELKRQLSKAVGLIEHMRPSCSSDYFRYDLVVCKQCEFRGQCPGEGFDCNEAIRKLLAEKE